MPLRCLLPLIIREKERLVFLNGTSNSKAELVEIEFRLFLREATYQHQGEVLRKYSNTAP